MRALDRAFIAAGIASLSMLIAVSSCDDNVKAEEKPTKQTLQATIEQGMWKVTYSGEKKEDEKESTLTNVEFQFAPDGSILAVNGKETTDGIWSAFESSNGLKFNMEFSDGEPFVDLNDDWVVVEQTRSRIELMGVEWKSGRVGKLTLEKV